MDTLNVRAELKERLMKDIDPNVSPPHPPIETLIPNPRIPSVRIRRKQKVS
jgi:hypothetical protein